MRPPGQSSVFTRELRIGRLFGWPLLAVMLAAGVGSGLAAIDAAGPAQPHWLVIPGVIPVCFALLSGRSPIFGAIAGAFAATLAFLTYAAYSAWQVACFIITFMGEC